MAEVSRNEVGAQESPIAILVDHNIEGQAARLWDTVKTEGWLTLQPLEMIMLADTSLPHDISDRQLWRYAQQGRMVLLTANRNMKGDDSLEQTMREENTPRSLPVLTISNSDRIKEREYRERCAERLFDIILEIDTYLGAARLFIP